MITLLTALILIAFSLFLYVHQLLQKSRSYFDKNGIPYVNPTWLVGNMGDVMMLKKPLAILHRDLYRALAPHKLAGLFVFHHRKSIMVRDPELIKQILVKDFAYFQNRGFEIHPDIEPLNHNLLTMKGEEWKNLRVKLTSTFTSGKIKLMFPLVKDCGDKLTDVLGAMTSEPFDVKDLCARYTTDAIGTCAFGIDINSLQNPRTEFRDMGKRIFEFRYRTIIRSLFPDIPKKIIKFFNIKFIDQKVEDFFYSIVKNTIKHREQNSISRHDFIDLLLSLKNHPAETYHDHEKSEINQYLSQLGEGSAKHNHTEMTLNVMAAQIFLFYTAGFETSSTALGYLMFELATNKTIQDKVREEINSVIESNPEGLTYEVLKNMSYVDMVISEILRKYPPASFLARKCNPAYQVPGTNVIIPEKTTVIIPVYGIHTDPQYYERPEEFYPEHFTEEAKANRPHYTYLPFGEGPRVCIAERFARMQVKIGLISMIRNYSYQVSPKTILPLTFVPNFGLLTAKHEIWLERMEIAK